jgi:tetratricopeptide (TPR) repeat protein
MQQDATQCNDLGNWLSDQGRLKEAEASYRRALELSPNFTEAHYNLGNALNRMARPEDACASYRRALSISPDYVDAYNNLGNTLNHLGRTEEAESCYLRAVGIRPDYFPVYNNLGNLLKDLGRLEEAESCYLRALELKPDFAMTHYNLGNVLKDDGRLVEAEASYLRALEFRPDYFEVYNNLGNTLKDLGRLEEAKERYLHSLELRPGFAETYFNLHGLLVNSHDLHPAIACMEKALEIDPANLCYRFYLGALLDYAGESETAARNFALIERGTGEFIEQLAAWRYIKEKSARRRLPITGTTVRTFEICLAAASREGLVLEFGVRHGTSIRQVASLVDRTVHGFDSFAGLPEDWREEAQGTYSTKGVLPWVPDNVVLHAGWFEETLPEFLRNHPGPVSFMNIDCDLYSSTKTVLDALSDRIIEGSVLVFDEYIMNEHWKDDEFKAFQEAVREYGWEYDYICFSLMTKQVAVRIGRQGAGVVKDTFQGDSSTNSQRGHTPFPRIFKLSSKSIALPETAASAFSTHVFSE